MNQPVQRPPLAAGPVDFDRYIDDRIDEGVFAVHRDIFRDEFLFELEMKYIFESNWVFLCHASQISRPHDFYTTHIGRQPVLVTRNAAGELKAFLNTCTHKGSLVCLTRAGNRKFHACTYHGWTFDTNGRCVSIKDHADAAYTPAFEAESHDLPAVPKLGEYRGWIFGSLNPDVLPLEEHLGDARVFIDLLVEQAPEGMELVRGNASYTFPGNWKLQVENCLDGYHLNIAHKGFIEITRRRIERAGAAYKGPDIEAMFGVNLKTGSFGLKNGHALFFTENPAPEFRPLWPQREQLAERLGAGRAKWLLQYGRNLTIFPNVQCTDNAVIGQFRVLRPLGTALTEMEIYCWVPVGEPPTARRQRLRQYEDFFNISSTGTPDDVGAYRNCQQGMQARAVDWLHGHGRGMGRMVRGGNDYSRELGIEPETSSAGPLNMSDETLFHANYRQWLRLMKDGQRRALAAGEIG